jgi:hypothetical protein
MVMHVGDDAWTACVWLVGSAFARCLPRRCCFFFSRRRVVAAMPIPRSRRSGAAQTRNGRCVHARVCVVCVRVVCGVCR